MTRDAQQIRAPLTPCAGPAQCVACARLIRQNELERSWVNHDEVIWFLCTRCLDDDVSLHWDITRPIAIWPTAKAKP